MRFLVSPLLLLCLLLSAAPARALPANRPTPGYVRVAMETDMGTIIVAVDLKHAPLTSANFLRYVDDGRFDGVTFYRAARRKSDAGQGLIQGGIDTDLRRALPPVKHEPTSQTGLHHVDATLSMARPDRPNSAMGNFFITVGPTPTMDASGAYIGYAAFGHVVAGMNVVKRILAVPTCCGSGPMRGQMIKQRVTIKRVRRLDGKAQPTGGPRPWMIPLRQVMEKAKK
jgi:peptidyl-prolyl cis-trans isomerase A (cyclophilin A)